MSVGCNVDPLNPSGSPSADELRQVGIRWVRLVSRPGVEQYVADMQANGIMVLAVVARESEGYVFGGPDIWQWGNEPDSSGPSSWTMTPAEYAGQFGFFQRTYPELVWIGAGLASGQPSYWQQVQSAGGLYGAAGFAVHPYNKTTAQASTLLKAYQKITPQLPLFVTEWNRPPAEIPPFASMLRQVCVAHAWFCWSDGQVANFGLTETRARLLAATT